MIPEKFKSRMKNLLKEEYDEFIRAIENDDDVKGVRINSLKLKNADTEDFKSFQINVSQ